MYSYLCDRTLGVQKTTLFDSSGWILRIKKVLGGRAPYPIGMSDNSPFVFAGLWEGWKDPANNEWLHTCLYRLAKNSISKSFTSFGRSCWIQWPAPGTRTFFVKPGIVSPKLSKAC